MATTTPHPRPRSAGDPDQCDLIMKGGITSGIVYPRAIAAFARRFRLRAIGGASAGAIAAAAAAAAEYGRLSGSRLDAYAELEGLPERLAGDGRGETPLSRLFQPEASTRALHRLLMFGLSPSKRRPGFTVLRWLLATAWCFPLAGLVGAVLAVAAGWVGWRALVPLETWTDWVALGLLAVAVLLAFALPLAAAVLRALLRSVPENLHGICTGLGGGAPDALTPWLHGVIQSLAGRGADEAPLTFGDLWHADGGAGDRHTVPRHRAIDFRLMTTALSHGRPYSWPLEPSAEFHFRAGDMARLFPASVVRWLEEHARALPDRRRIEGCLPLPSMAELPLIVAVRMSLAFPVLLSAVPLYALRLERGVGWMAERVWFSDGGICSNFPVHFFDAVLPTRPTFAINLVDDRRVPATPRDPEDFVFVPADNNEGQEQPELSLKRGGRPSLIGLLAAVKDTMHNWNDNTQLRVPGFRDRIAQVRLTKDEGGMNLRMGAEIIRRVAGRGQFAAETLIEHFFPSTLPAPGERREVRTDWRNHRWVRFRTAAALFEESLLGLLEAERRTADSEASVEALHLEPPSYAYGSEGRAEASMEGYQKLLDAARWFLERGGVMGEAVFDPAEAPVPRPRSQLRIRPRL